MQPFPRALRLVGQLGAHLGDLLRLRVDEFVGEVDGAAEAARLQPAVQRHLPRPLRQHLAVLAFQLRFRERQRPAPDRRQGDEQRETPENRAVVHGKSLLRNKDRSGTPAASTAARPPSSRSTRATTPRTSSSSLRHRSTALSVLAPVVTTSSSTHTRAPRGRPFFPSTHWLVPCPFGSLRT